MNQTISIQAVKGGFILTTTSQTAQFGFTTEQEVISSPGKLMKAVRALIEPAAEAKTLVKQD